jgi:hypothetical protein
MIKNKNMVLVPKKNLNWKLDNQVKNWINLTNKQERLDFINSLNDDLLDNLYIWRLGFDIPNLRNKKIDSLLESVWKIKN